MESGVHAQILLWTDDLACPALDAILKVHMVARLAILFDYLMDLGSTITHTRDIVTPRTKTADTFIAGSSV